MWHTTIAQPRTRNFQSDSSRYRPKLHTSLHTICKRPPLPRTQSLNLIARNPSSSPVMPKKRPHAAGRASKPSLESDTVFFYMPGEKPYGVFCQWHPSPITIPTTSLDFLTTNTPTASAISTTYAPCITFSCAEQANMFSKALFFASPTSCAAILSTSDPKQQKQLGQVVSHFNAWKWTQVKSRVVRVVNWYEFTDRANKGMKSVLLGTGERGLAEASPWDRVWGFGSGG